MSNRKEWSFSVRDVVAGYDRQAEELAERYERFAFENVHAEVLDLLPEAGGSVLDVGAGSGRDAAWFASEGYRVAAVEPSSKLREAARARHKNPNINWINDRLPSLKEVLRSKLTFDLVWLSAMWMHVPPKHQRRALRKLVSVMSPGASMMISLRYGPPDPSRPMHEIRLDELESLARDCGLQIARETEREDLQKRPGVSWKIVWLRLPDDGTNALPLLRHVVFNDRKSSTYKLALLRVLVRIADGASGYASEGENGRIELPLGLVALYWIRAFRPLIERGFPQLGGRTGMSFAKEAFRGLFSRSQFDLKVGQVFSGQDAENLVTAMREAADCILRMPAHHITFPGSTENVFHGALKRKPRYNGRVFDALRIDDEFLWSFGTFSMPEKLWRAMTRFAPWIEPAIVAEWIDVMRSYQREGPTSWEQLMAGLEWLDPEHDTSLVRRRVEELRKDNLPIYCVWTKKHLRRSIAIDHCFPFAAWPCNDLWNLLPSHPKANGSKSDRLPAPDLLLRAKPLVLEWWDAAYCRDKVLEKRFLDESSSALPLAKTEGRVVTPESIFNGLMVQQSVLKRDQQLEEWAPQIRS